MEKERDFGLNNDSIAEAVRASSRAMHQVVMDSIERKVTALLEDKKVFLDPDMSLQKLSSLTSTNATYLSNTVNDCFGCNFRTLLNKYRIEYAKFQISNEGGLVKDIYKNCGFVSRSAFYRSFKQETGLTPLQFLKQIISDNGHYRKWNEGNRRGNWEKAGPGTPDINSKYNKNKSDGLIDYKQSYTHLK